MCARRANPSAMIAITAHALSGWHHGHAPVFNRAIMRWPDIASPFTMPEPHKNGTMNAHSVLCFTVQRMESPKIRKQQTMSPAVDTKDLTALSHIPCRNVRPENCSVRAILFDQDSHLQLAATCRTLPIALFLIFVRLH